MTQFVHLQQYSIYSASDTSQKQTIRYIPAHDNYSLIVYFS